MTSFMNGPLSRSEHRNFEIFIVQCVSEFHFNFLTSEIFERVLRGWFCVVFANPTPKIEDVRKQARGRGLKKGSQIIQWSHVKKPQETV